MADPALQLMAAQDDGGQFAGGSVGSLPDLPNFGYIRDLGDNEPIYDAFACKCENISNAGVHWSPLAGSPGSRTVATWSVHGGYGMKKITWAARAIGGKPVMPSFDTGDPNDVLLDRVIVADIPSQMPSGSQVWELGGYYLYVQQVGSALDDPIPTGQHPLSVIPAASNLLSPQDFSRILGNAPVTGAAGFHVHAPPAFVSTWHQTTIVSLVALCRSSLRSSNWPLSVTVLTVASILFDSSSRSKIVASHEVTLSSRGSDTVAFTPAEPLRKPLKIRAAT